MLSVYLYKNLFYLRKLNGWTQAEMQDWCGVSRANWSNYENGNTEPDIQTIANISRAFKVSIDDLVLKNFESEYKNGNLNYKSEGSKNDENGNVNSNLKGNLNSKKEGYYTPADGAETTANEPTEVGTWAILGQLKQMDEKLDQLLLSAEKAPKK